MKTCREIVEFYRKEIIHNLELLGDKKFEDIHEQIVNALSIEVNNLVWCFNHIKSEEGEEE